MTTTRHRDGWVMAGMAIAAASAATASFTGLRGLAAAAGWPDRLAWLLPVTIDAYAMTSVRVWLAPAGHPRRGRGSAQANAIGAIGASILGNAAYHTLSMGLLTVTWPIVVVVGAVPAAVLGLTAHLHALHTLDRDRPTGPTPISGPGDGPACPPEDGTGRRTETGPEGGPQDVPEDGTGDEPEDRTRSGPPPGPVPRPRARPRRHAKPRTEDDLIAAARAADTRYRASHHGRPITRDALRVALHIAGPRATELRRQLAADPTPPAPAPAPPPAPALLTTPTSPITNPEPTATPDRKEAHSTT